jgi:FtsH-binding integral membrane protein
MNYGYSLDQPIAIQAERSERAAFIRRTYAHLAGALGAFVAILFCFFQFAPDSFQAQMLIWMMSPISSLIILAAFIGVGYLARMWAYNGGSQAMQYMGLALYVVFEAIIFVPLLFIVLYYYRDPSILTSAGVLTACVFGGLTTAVFVTRKDFSFLGPILSIASWLILGVVLIAVFFPASFNLGMWFSLLAIALACGFILYDTSNVIHHFRTDQHVAASLELFASVAYLLYYVILLLAQSRRN